MDWKNGAINEMNLKAKVWIQVAPVWYSYRNCAVLSF